MTAVMMDSDLRAKLNGLTQTLDVIDESGDVVGCFVPKAELQAMMSAWAATRWSPDDERRLAAQTGGRPLAEIWKDLGRS